VTLPTAFQLPSNCLCVGPPITPRVLEHPTPGWNRAGVPTPRSALTRLAHKRRSDLARRTHKLLVASEYFGCVALAAKLAPRMLISTPADA
jgi:hypothetical protein